MVRKFLGKFYNYASNDIGIDLGTSNTLVHVPKKGIVLNDGTNLTSGRVPFATTNGRLTDDADFTFSTDTLTITKIAQTTFTAFPLTPSSAPDADYEVANKKYVDDSVEYS